MKVAREIIRQVSDLMAYLLIPAVAVVTPAAFSRWLIGRVSRWRWLLAEGAGASLEGASKHLVIGDRRLWMSRWKQVELLDFRDLYMMLCGRSRQVLEEIECSVPIETARDRAMIGMHWGPAISILKLLAVSGLRPAFPFRGPEPRLRRSRPVYYFASKLAAHYLSRTLADRAVPVGGASKVLEGLLQETGTICVLMDTPPMHGRRTMSGQLLGRSAEFNAGFPAILAKQGREYLFYAMNLHADGSLKKQLELDGPHRADSSEHFLSDFAGFMERHLRADPATWRFWQVEQQFWKIRPSVDSPEERRPGG